MRKKKDPFVNYPSTQISIIESTLFVIQIGPEVFESEGQWFFMKKAAEQHFERIWTELMNHIYNGSKKQQKEARYLICNLKILPLRMH